MKFVYFVHQDKNSFERQSDGVELCVIPEFQDGLIYFYCQEYAMFWRSIYDVGDFEKTCNFCLENRIRPATLIEISDCNLIKYVDLVKEYNIVDGKVKEITYINLK